MTLEYQIPIDCETQSGKLVEKIPNGITFT